MLTCQNCRLTPSAHSVPLGQTYAYAHQVPSGTAPYVPRRVWTRQFNTRVNSSNCRLNAERSFRAPRANARIQSRSLRLCGHRAVRSPQGQTSPRSVRTPQGHTYAHRAGPLWVPQLRSSLPRQPTLTEPVLSRYRSSVVAYQGSLRSPSRNSLVTAAP